ncbi:hypothetical protein HanXRQr2_Chr10g0452291 [Helianthus annuus]|uniref:Uncharacterized protein n=1 Tax=Helianthus annuus TaxID=4232 RepID=A0A9K3HZP0_HELAN|nr:hypothetical protein HanXRQr2_Chr10g0452291 [Helianthus annuus]
MKPLFTSATSRSLFLFQFSSRRSRLTGRPNPLTPSLPPPHLGLPVHLNGRPTTTCGGGVQRLQQQWRTAATSLERRRETVREREGTEKLTEETRRDRRRMGFATGFTHHDFRSVDPSGIDEPCRRCLKAAKGAYACGSFSGFTGDLPEHSKTSPELDDEDNHSRSCPWILNLYSCAYSQGFLYAINVSILDPFYALTHFWVQHVRPLNPSSTLFVMLRLFMHANCYA